MKLKWPLVNLLLIAVAGVILRLAFVIELPWLEYANLLHAHSHLAILGWGFLGISTLLVHSFLPKEKAGRPVYRRIFYGALFSLWGMFVAFIVENYGLFSITFSTLFLLWSYGFIWQFRRDLASVNSDLGKRNFSLRFLNSALFFYVFSTLALWGLAVINLLHLQGTPIYYMTIQFFLHFQFNGWFLFAIPALFFQLLERYDIRLSPNALHRYWQLLVVSCLLTYALAVTWSTPIPFIFWVNSLGVLLQLAALYFLLSALRGRVKEIKALFPHEVRVLFSVALSSYVLKIIIQTVVVIPYVATIAYTVRNYVIGFVHLMLLGILTASIFSLAGFRQMLPMHKAAPYWGIRLFVPSFVIMEVLLFLQGSLFWLNWGFLPYYYEALFVVSALLMISIFLLLLPLFHARNPINSNTKPSGYTQPQEV